MKQVARVFVGTIILFVTIYGVVTYTPQVQQMVGGNGIQTEKKVKGISDSVAQDVRLEVQKRASEAGEVKVNDIVSSVSRLQRIPQDIQSLKQFIDEKVKYYTTK